MICIVVFEDCLMYYYIDITQQDGSHKIKHTYAAPEVCNMSRDRETTFWIMYFWTTQSLN